MNLEFVGGIVVALLLLRWWAVWTRRRYLSHPHPPRWLIEMETMRRYLSRKDPPERG